VPWVMTHMHAMRITQLSSELSNAITAFVSFTVVPNNGFLQRRNNFAGDFDYSPRFNSSEFIPHAALISSSTLSCTTYSENWCPANCLRAHFAERLGSYEMVQFDARSILEKFRKLRWIRLGGHGPPEFVCSKSIQS